MTPEQVRESQDDSGLQPSGDGVGSDDLALEVSDGNASGLSVVDDQVDESDGVIAEILEETPGVFTATVKELTEEHDVAMELHRTYHDRAINGTEVSLNNPAEDAQKYLDLAIRATSEKSSLLRTMLTVLGKGKKKSQDAPSVNVSGDNMKVVNICGSHRDTMAKIDQINGASDGKRSAADVRASIKLPGSRG